MNRMLVPLSATRRRAANRRSTSGPGSEAVGSSSTSSGTGLPVSARARATAMAVRSDAASVDTIAVGSISKPSRSMAAWARRRSARRSSLPTPV